MKLQLWIEKTPLIIQNPNNEVRRFIERYCKDLTYEDEYNMRTFGDPKRNIKVRFAFKDWINEPLELDYDIIIYTGCIYDPLYAQANSKETLNIATQGLFNLIRNIKSNRERNPLLIFMSSVNVYGDQSENKEEEITENTIPNPKTVLELSLYNQENMIKSLAPLYDVDYMIFRLGNLVGEFTSLNSLVNSAVTALLLQKPTFEIYNYKNSIALLDEKDLGNTLNSILQLYQEGGEKYDKLCNQVFNLKSDEREETTVETVVQSIFATANHLPQIGFDHFKEMSIKGMTEPFKLKAPKIKYGISQSKPTIVFGKPISTKKANELLKFVTLKPLVWSLLPTTAHFLLNYVLGNMHPNVRKCIEKILNLPVTPTPENVDKDKVNQDVLDVVKDVSENIDKSLS